MSKQSLTNYKNIPILISDIALADFIAENNDENYIKRKTLNFAKKMK